MTAWFIYLWNLPALSITSTVLHIFIGQIYILKFDTDSFNATILDYV